LQLASHPFKEDETTLQKEKRKKKLGCMYDGLVILTIEQTQKSKNQVWYITMVLKNLKIYQRLAHNTPGSLSVLS
jgi:hypothetical protein